MGSNSDINICDTSRLIWTVLFTSLTCEKLKYCGSSSLQICCQIRYPSISGKSCIHHSVVIRVMRLKFHICRAIIPDIFPKRKFSSSFLDDGI